DPVCVLPYGHNPTGIRAFNATLSRYFRETIPLVCAKLPPDVEMPKGTGRMFGFYYPAHIKLPGNVQPGKLRKALLRDWRKAINGARRFAAKNLRLPLAEDPMRWQARNDWKKIFA